MTPSALASDQRRLRAMTLSDVLHELPSPFRGAVAETIAAYSRSRVAKTEPDLSARLSRVLFPDQAAASLRLDADSRAACGRCKDAQP